MKLNYKQLYNIPSFYRLLDIKSYSIVIKYIIIDIIEQNNGAKIMCNFNNGCKYTVLWRLMKSIITKKLTILSNLFIII